MQPVFALRKYELCRASAGCGDVAVIPLYLCLIWATELHSMNAWRSCLEALAICQCVCLSAMSLLWMFYRVLPVLIHELRELRKWKLLALQLIWEILSPAEFLAPAEFLHLLSREPVRYLGNISCVVCSACKECNNEI